MQLDLNFCLLSAGTLLLAQIREFPPVCMCSDDVITELFLVTKNEQEGHGILENPFHFKFSHLKCSALLADKRPNEVPFNRP